MNWVLNRPVGKNGLLWLFVRQDLEQRFRGNVLGVAWALLAPVAQLATFWFVFVHIFKARVPGLEGVGYISWLALGMWPWFAVSEALMRASTTFVDQASLISKVAVPRHVLVMARVVGAFALHAAGFAVVLVLLAAGGVALQWQYVPAAFALWPLLMLFSFGLGLGLSVWQVFFRDMATALPMVMTLWFFLTPIFYAREMLPDAAKPFAALNPLTGFVQATRHLLLDGQLDVRSIGFATLAALVVAGLGIAMFSRLKTRFEDFL